MYPRLSDIFQDLFGFSFPIPLYSFGVMVALAVWAAAWFSRKELDRLHANKLIGSVTVKPQTKEKKPKVIKGSPGVIMWDVAVGAVFIGFIGAKFFHILENLDTFAQDPMAMIFSRGGFTFYGGLLVATIFVAWYVRRKGLSVPRFADALAPGLMLAYGIGRIGCHLSGDGDWGIESNLADKPGWVPAWLWNETYPNNILGIDLSAQGVYPTPLYEFAAASALFGALWMMRKHAFAPGWLFSVYLIFSGFERLLIEQIRVNNTFGLFGMDVTQAEVISVFLMVAGIVGLIYTSRKTGRPALG